MEGVNEQACMHAHRVRIGTGPDGIGRPNPLPVSSCHAPVSHPTHAPLRSVWMPIMVTARDRDMTSSSVCTPAMGTGSEGFEASLAVNIATMGSAVCAVCGLGGGMFVLWSESPRHAYHTQHTHVPLPPDGVLPSSANMTSGGR